MSKIFEDEFMEAQVSLLNLCRELIDDQVDMIYLYCCMEEYETTFDCFFTINGKGIDVRYFKTPLDVQDQFLKLGMEDLRNIQEVCKRYGKRAPAEIKMIYNVKTRQLQTKYVYGYYHKEKDISAEEVFEAWAHEIDPKYNPY